MQHDTATLKATWRHLRDDRVAGFTILVGALGYFVDVFDLLLFSIVRVKSLKDVGVAAADALPLGVKLINIQMAGLLVGGFIWGVIGDRFGFRASFIGSSTPPRQVRPASSSSVSRLSVCI